MDLKAIPPMPVDRSGAGMPADRSGTGNEFLTRKEQYQREKEARKAKADAEKQQKHIAQQLNAPVTHEQLQRALIRMYAGMERLAQEVRDVGIRSEAILQYLYDEDVINREQYVEYAKNQQEWNLMLNGIEMSLRNKEVSLREIVKQIHEWNAVHKMKISWQHVDIAPVLRDDENLTLEEKLLIASELEMPEVFINELRLKDTLATSSIDELTEGLDAQLAQTVEPTEAETPAES